MPTQRADTVRENSAVVTSSGAFVVASGIVDNVLWVSGCGAGGGGNSGSAMNTQTSATASGAGSSGQSCKRIPLYVTAGETLTIVVGAAGTGGVAVSRSTTGTTNGNLGTDGTNTTIARGSQVLLQLLSGLAGTGLSTNGVAQTFTALGDTFAGQAGSVASAYGVWPAAADGADDTSPYSIKGGQAGAASAFGHAVDGGDAVGVSGADCEGETPTIGGPGSGGAGGGSAVSTSTYTATSGAGADGGASILLFEWLEYA